MNKGGCPICGYKDITVLDQFGCTTYEICDSCGCESGVEYDRFSSEDHLAAVRNNWFVDEKCEWWSSEAEKPENWEPIIQMKKAGITVPKS